MYGSSCPGRRGWEACLLWTPRRQGPLGAVGADVQDDGEEVVVGQSGPRCAAQPARAAKWGCPGPRRRIGGPAAGPRTRDDCEERAGRSKMPMRRPAAELQEYPITPVGGPRGLPYVDVWMSENPGADGVHRRRRTPGVKPVLFGVVLPTQ